MQSKRKYKVIVILNRGVSCVSWNFTSVQNSENRFVKGDKAEINPPVYGNVTQ